MQNFSMLMSKFRIDIEDKGCWGEALLIAMEVLFQAKPPFAILKTLPYNLRKKCQNTLLENEKNNYRRVSINQSTALMNTQTLKQWKTGLNGKFFKKNYVPTTLSSKKSY